MEHPEPSPIFTTVARAADILGCKPYDVVRLADAGQLDATMRDGLRLVSIPSIVKLAGAAS